MRVAYFGHPDHVWSGSDSFFLEFLRGFSEVHEFRPTAIEALEQSLEALFGDFDLYVFWQHDFLAYPFIKARRRTVVVPMLDGSGHHPGTHWNRLSSALFISFSSNLHDFIRFRGGKSLLLRFAMKPGPYSNPSAEQVYFWPRPQSTNSLSILEARKLADLIDPDLPLVIRVGEGGLAALGIQAVGQGLKRLEYRSVKDRDEHLELVSQSLALVAPRRVEGIGMSFIEALAMGRAVLGLDSPTLNEYVQHGKNGVIWSQPVDKLLVSQRLRNFDRRFLESAGKDATEMMAAAHVKFLRDMEELQVTLIRWGSLGHPTLTVNNKIWGELQMSERVYKGLSRTKSTRGISLTTFIKLRQSSIASGRGRFARSSRRWVG